jgi:hypothetical protein
MEKITKDNKDDLILFTNVDDEDFVGMWGGKEYTIRAGEIQSFYRYMTYHFAKHLIDKILLKEDPEGKKLGDTALREELENKIIGGQVEKPTKVERSDEEIEKEKEEKQKLELEKKEAELKVKRAEILKVAREAKAKKAKANN